MIIVLPTSDGGYLIGMEPDPSETSKRRVPRIKQQHLLKLRTAKRHIAKLRRWMRLSQRYAN